MVISCNLNEAILSYGGMGVRRGDFILYYQQLKLKNYTILKYTTCNFIWLKCKIYDFMQYPDGFLYYIQSQLF